MQQMIRAHGLIPTLTREAPAALGALLIAEAFYKFHSFTLECLAFLATWYALSWVAGRLFPRSPRNQEAR
ncbi:MAG TPA: hypothetical protein VLC55_05315 [Burkholderiales bacterium]|nr:hypothetical protein [Burkholderiales bacterium]